jgi:hypothetical protein
VDVGVKALIRVFIGLLLVSIALFVVMLLIDGRIYDALGVCVVVGFLGAFICAALADSERSEEP